MNVRRQSPALRWARYKEPLLEVLLRRGAILVVVLTLGVFAAFLLIDINEPPSSANREWPQIDAFSRAIFPGAADFQAKYANYDSPSFVFSYRCPPGTTAASAFAHFKTAYGWHRVEREGDHVLVLRYSGEGDPRGQVALFRFRFDAASAKMTVLRINEREDAARPSWFVAKAEKIHKRYLRE